MKKLFDAIFKTQPVERHYDPLASDVQVAREQLRTAQQEMDDLVRKLLEQNENLRGRHAHLSPSKKGS